MNLRACLLFALLASACGAVESHRLLYLQPAPDTIEGWERHSLPIGCGNFGATAGMTEMLLQSQADGIDLLPALPEAWAKRGGFRGLCARGAYEVDCRWQAGAPVEVTVRSKKGRPCPEVRFVGEKVRQDFIRFL